MGSNDDAINTDVDNKLEDIFGDAEERHEIEADPKMAMELDTRLDDFFSDEGPSSTIDNEDVKPEPKKQAVKEKPAAENPPGEDSIMQDPVLDSEDSPLRNLKSVVLSLEWEISDDVMFRLGDEVGVLEKKYKKEKIIVAFLQILGSLGKYIHKKKADAHPDSIALLNSVYDTFEKAMLAPDLSEMDKKKLLAGEVNKYKKLKVIISKTPSREEEKEVDDQPRKAGYTTDQEEDRGPDESTPESVSPASTAIDGASARAIVEALERIGQSICTELSALREEIKRSR